MATALERRISRLQDALEARERLATGTVRQHLRGLQKSLRAFLADFDEVGPAQYKTVKAGVRLLVQAAFLRMVTELEQQARQAFQQGMDDADDMVGPEAKAVGQPVMLSEALGAPSQLLRDTATEAYAGLIQAESEATIRRISSTAARGALGQGGLLQIQKEIGRNLSSSLTFSSVALRAETIARTEVGRIYSMANQARTEQLAQYLPGLQKEWVAARDDRTRRAHSMAHGQRVEVDKPFNVGGENLLYPRDPAGSAGNTINCRCTSVPVPGSRKKPRERRPVEREGREASIQDWLPDFKKASWYESYVPAHAGGPNPLEVQRRLQELLSRHTRFARSPTLNSAVRAGKQLGHDYSGSLARAADAKLSGLGTEAGVTNRALGDATLMMDIVNQAGSLGRNVFRGVYYEGVNADALLAQLKNQKLVDIPLSTASFDTKVAEKLAGGLPWQEGTSVIMELQGANGVPLGLFSDLGLMRSEVAISGRFQIVSVTKQGEGLYVKVKQVAQLEVG